MTRNEQKIAMLEKLTQVLNALPKSNSIREISQKTGIPESTVRSLLHKPILIAELLDIENEPETLKAFMLNIQKWYEKNKYIGSRIGQAKSREHPKIK